MPIPLSGLPKAPPVSSLVSPGTGRCGLPTLCPVLGATVQAALLGGSVAAPPCPVAPQEAVFHIRCKLQAGVWPGPPPGGRRAKSTSGAVEGLVPGP